MIDKLDCEVIRDLLVLYTDDVCSRSSAQLVSEHLNSCAECRKYYEAMSAKLDKPDKKFSDVTMFKRIMQYIAVIAAVAAVFGVCIAVNLSDAWEGGSAGIGNLICTIMYILIFAAFNITARRYRGLMRVSFTLGLLTLISSLLCLAVRLGVGFMLIPSLILAVFSSVPFYGLRFFFDWTAVYTITAIISLISVIYSCISLKRIGRNQKFMLNK